VVCIQLYSTLDLSQDYFLMVITVNLFETQP